MDKMEAVIRDNVAWRHKAETELCKAEILSRLYQGYASCDVWNDHASDAVAELNKQAQKYQLVLVHGTVRVIATVQAVSDHPLEHVFKRAWDLSDQWPTCPNPWDKTMESFPVEFKRYVDYHLVRYSGDEYVVNEEIPRLAKPFKHAIREILNEYPYLKYKLGSADVDYLQICYTNV
jgi:hypothetical protein